MNLNEARTILEESGYTLLQEATVAPYKFTAPIKIGKYEICWLHDPGIGDNHYRTHTLVDYHQFRDVVENLKGSGWHVIQRQEVDDIKGSETECKKFIDSIPRGYKGYVNHGYPGRMPDIRVQYVNDKFRFYGLYTRYGRFFFPSSIKNEYITSDNDSGKTDYACPVCIVKDYTGSDKHLITYHYTFWSPMAYSRELDGYAKEIGRELKEWAKTKGVEINKIDYDSDSDDSYACIMEITTYTMYHDMIASFLEKEKRRAPGWVGHGISGLYD